MTNEEKRYLETLKQVLERAKNYSALDAIEKLEKENAELEEIRGQQVRIINNDTIRIERLKKENALTM